MMVTDVRVEQASEMPLSGETWVSQLARGRAKRTVTMLLEGLRDRLAVSRAYGGGRTH
jgi:hypothetical protein